MLPSANEKDLRGLPDAVRSQMRITFATSMDEVMERMLLGPVSVERDADGPVQRAKRDSAPRADDQWLEG
jgi:hypothetical protein